MTAYRFVTLTCDTCGEIWDHGISTTVREARARAKAAGWTTDRADGYVQDHCRNHKEVE